jgi:hypothetical protein
VKRLKGCPLPFVIFVVYQGGFHSPGVKFFYQFNDAIERSAAQEFDVRQTEDSSRGIQVGHQLVKVEIKLFGRICHDTFTIPMKDSSIEPDE